jgi:hypothetical protein
MSYVYTPKFPTTADVLAVATQLAQRQSDSGTTNGGITGSPTVPQLGADAAGLGIAYLQAMADVALCSTGLQLYSLSSLSTANTASGTFADVPGTTITFSAPFAKTYTVHCDFAFFASSVPTVSASLRLVVNGSNGPTMSVLPAVVNAVSSTHLMMVTSCAAGANTIKLQWAAGASQTINTSAACYANYIVSG